MALAGVDGIERLDRRRLDGSPLPHDEWQVTRALAGETVSRELSVLHLPDGRRLVVEVDATPIRDEHGNVTTVVLTYEDVTERERREQADREFLSNAAHQLRTPLTAIASTVAALQSGAKDAPAERDRFLAHLERETDRLARLGRALLTLARAQRGETEPDVTVVAVRPLLESLARSTPTPTGVRVAVDCDPTVAALANPDLLAEALANLVSNAVTHTHEGDIVLAAARSDGTTVITVSDSGTGIPAELRDRVFERFFRAPAAQPAQGFGLGLPIAKAALEAMHGSIEIASTNGTGTTVRVVVPGAQLVR